MGASYEINCTECMFSAEVGIGSGMFWNRRNLFYGSKPDDEKPMLEDFVESDEIRKRAYTLIKRGAILRDFGSEMYYCPKCNRLDNLFYFRLRTIFNKYEPEYECPYCKEAKLERVYVAEMAGGRFDKDECIATKKLCEFACPECGQKGLKFGGKTMLWD